MSSVASASESRVTVTPGVVFRVSAVASSVAVGLVVVSAVLELGTTHWGVALVALPLLVANVVLARIAYPTLLGRCFAALGAFLVAIALGGVVGWSDEAAWATAVHVGAAALALGAALAVVASALRGATTPLASARDYLTLTKPRIMTLLLLTGAAGMFVGAQGVPPLGLFAATMLGLALACGGASALNHLLDRDIDALMGSRTEKRPVATGRVT
ncbi:MAG TPA: UbiA family prenyltransferase, partial [Gaiellaceae bacterium]|nr:UbiA family prenyltransferase [Gaiellaceae bacterium]